MGYVCERIAIGTFERGPIHLVIEAHSNGSPPPQCRADAPDGPQFVILNSLLLDDLELSTYLNTTYGMPTALAVFSTGQEAVGPLVEHHWSWSVSGGGISTVTVVEDTLTTIDPDGVIPPRYFWPRDAGMAYLDLDIDRSGPNSNRLANGTFAAPMLFSELLDGVYVGPGEWHPRAEVDGTFRFFEDRLCQKPIA